MQLKGFRKVQENQNRRRNQMDLTIVKGSRSMSGPNELTSVQTISNGYHDRTEMRSKTAIEGVKRRLKDANPWKLHA